MKKCYLFIISVLFALSLDCFGQFEKHTHFVGGGVDIDTWDDTMREFELNVTYGYYIANNSAVGGELSFYQRDVNSINVNLDLFVGLFYRYNFHPFPYVFVQPTYLIAKFDEHVGVKYGHIFKPGLGLTIPVFHSFAIEVLISNDISFQFSNFKMRPYHFNTQVKIVVPFNLKTN